MGRAQAKVERLHPERGRAEPGFTQHRPSCRRGFGVFQWANHETGALTRSPILLTGAIAWECLWSSTLRRRLAVSPSTWRCGGRMVSPVIRWADLRAQVRSDLSVLDASFTNAWRRSGARRRAGTLTFALRWVLGRRVRSWLSAWRRCQRCPV